MAMFKCECCQDEFVYIGSDEDAEQELKEHYPNTPVENCATVCEDCYAVFRRHIGG